ncbi:sensor histidine kinase [Pseudomonas sichuanensis]|uniref:HAMP domain-containing sensor histidine kinase n=1 Tax=Pseudomonas sichuanensis TaxID=2213015 RepID=UPI0024492410|nr:sensor histidine kinase [Pseudomonas sichuanensis]MDH0734011.1 sensor histidine kinase [Pseudomonas sichuanensis]MDH1581913.1 sensor histidine kinase [Pseudomonas sichuanensis]MDH1591409.1 sensor histidine kinase [Pseudomonas sichuanensis]MDH1597049.1 sensor histidine kinase [Pseudomonas sichuanensis]
MLDRHSLFWKLAILLVGFCLLMIGLSYTWGRHMETQNAFLSEPARQVLRGYAAEAEQAWQAGGQDGVDRWLEGMHSREKGWVGVLDGDLQPLGSFSLGSAEVQHLTRLRGVDWPMSRRTIGQPWLRLPFPNSPDQGSLVIELPERFNPGQYRLFWRVITNGIIPGLFTLLLCVGLYRMLIVPLNQLREQARAWRADQLTTRLDSRTIQRRDELGELARAFDQMAERLQGTVVMQQQLLRDLSHEMRTPLSRLRVACDGETDLERLRERVHREVDGMQQLVEDTLQLAWQDAERAPMNLEPIQLPVLWDMLSENACYESGWAPQRLVCTVPLECWVQGNLNHLAQALENILRNAIRHSPIDGQVHLSGKREGGYWRIELEDEGGGVAEEDLERIFAPFSRLDGSRPGDGGFGLGLSIARSAIRRQGGKVWAVNGERGLRVCMRLAAGERDSSPGKSHRRTAAPAECDGAQSPLGL